VSCARRKPMAGGFAIASRFSMATGKTLSSLVKSAIENPVYTALLIAPGPKVSTRAARRAFSLVPTVRPASADA